MSEIRATTISDAAGTGPVTLTKQSAAKAWVQITKSTDTINGSFNVSSLTDIGAGQTTVTFTNAMANGDCAATANNRSVSTGLGVFAGPASNGTSWAVYTRDSASTLTDYNFSSSIHGDLA